MLEKNPLLLASILSAAWPISNASAGDLAEPSIESLRQMEVTSTVSKAETVLDGARAIEIALLNSQGPNEHGGLKTESKAAKEKPVLEKPGAESAETLEEAFTKGKFSLSLRYRLALIDDAGFAETATASTLQTLLSYETKPYHGVSIFVQGRNVAHLGNDDFNDTLNGNTARPVEADPESTALHQAYVKFTPQSETTIHGGRRRIVINNQRFVGSLGWRQNDRAFDGVSIENKSLPNTKATYVYSFNVNRAFTNRSSIGNFSGGTNIHLLNIQHKVAGVGEITGYALLAELDGFPAASGLSTQTYGVFLNGGRKISDHMKVLYRAEGAFQSDYQNNPNGFDATYYHFIAGVQAHGATLKAGIEQLGSDNGARAVSAPLGLLHAFNGHADRFLATPADGLRDKYVKASLKKKLGGGKFPVLNAHLAYHDFSAEDGGRHFGSEWNAGIAMKVHKRFTAAAIYADFNGDQGFVDTQKFWIMLKSSI